MAESEHLLNVEDMNVYYGSIHAIQGVSFHVDKGEIVTLIGANGAGKSTTLNTVSGLLRSKTVEVYLDESLRRFSSVFPAAGSSNSAIEMPIPELERVSAARGWVDVCKSAESTI